MTASRITDGLGGCFNTGAGILSVADDYSNILELNTTFMLVNETYVIEVIASKNGQSATAKTRVELRSADFIDVNIK